ncbi:hypothetical protein BOX15_Mlig023203g1, partial [Macrostomum lignano]
SMPRQLVSYYDTLVTQSDYDTLHDGMWLNDNIISFALEYIDRTKCRGSNNGTQWITLLDPTVCQAVKLTGQAVELLAQRDLRACEFLANTSLDSMLSFCIDSSVFLP